MTTSTSDERSDAGSALPVSSNDHEHRVDLEEERARIAQLLASHAPPDWEERFERDQLLDAIIDTTPLQMSVMAADIRESTLLMKEAVRFEQFAKIMDKFVSAVRSGIGTPGGWFDKFTGDGFLAYWIAPASPKDEYQRRFVEAAGVAGGDVIDVDIELDRAPREVTVPPDLATALKKDQKATKTFEGLSYSNKRWHVQSIEGAKTDETRQRRIAKSVRILHEGRPR